MTLARFHADPPPADGPDGPICRITELAVIWCGHCRYPDAGHRRLRDRLSRRSARRTVEVEVTHTFRARFSGPCSTCDRQFERGELIGATADLDYLCRECL